MPDVVDVVIVGGGPAGLSAALALGRARKRVLLCDAGPRRNAAAVHLQNFVTRDGTPPEELRRIGRQQLGAYPSVEVREVGALAITGQRGAFEVRLASGSVLARRVVLCVGMVDEVVEIEGFRELWGRSIVQCPYCHAWEVQDRRFGALATSVELLDFALLLRGWSSEVVALTDGRYAVPAEAAERLARAGVRLEERRIARLIARDGRLERVELEGGALLPLDVIFAKPPQRQVALVRSLGLALDPNGYVQLDDHRQTSVPGIYAAGDLVTPMQAAIMAAAAGSWPRPC
jgi:thioredoxin reductase